MVTHIREQFKQLQLTYGLQHPDQIKQRILWNNLQMVIRKLYDGPETLNTLKQFDMQWKILEAIENEEIKKGR